MELVHAGTTLGQTNWISRNLLKPLANHHSTTRKPRKVLYDYLRYLSTRAWRKQDRLFPRATSRRREEAEHKKPSKRRVLCTGWDRYIPEYAQRAIYELYGGTRGIRSERGRERGIENNGIELTDVEAGPGHKVPVNTHTDDRFYEQCRRILLQSHPLSRE